MFKPLLVVSAVLISLGSGLVSCSPDNGKTKVVDNFKVAAPMLKRAGQTDLTLTKEAVASVSGAGLQDQIVFATGKPYKVSYDTICRRGDETFRSKTESNAQEPAAIFQLVPEVILALDLKKTLVTCSIHIAITNEIGSNQHTELSSLAISEGGAGDLDLSLNSQPISEVESTNTEGIFISSPQRRTGTLDLVCEDLKFPSQDFPSELAFSRIDLGQAVAKDKTNVNVRYEHPSQNCRALLKEGNRVIATTSLFTLNFPLPPPTVTIIPVANPQIMNINGTLGIQLHTVRVANPVAGGRTLTLVQKAYLAKTIAYAVMAGPNNFAIGAKVVGNPQARAVLGTPNTPSSSIFVPGNSSVDIPVWFTFASPLQCQAGQLKGYSLQVVEPLEIGLRGPQGKVEASLIVQGFPEVLAFAEPGLDTNLFRPAPDAADFCSWR